MRARWVLVAVLTTAWVDSVSSQGVPGCASPRDGEVVDSEDDNFGVEVCCAVGCAECRDESDECKNDTAKLDGACCPSQIAASDESQSCDDTTDASGPCIIDSGEEPTPAPASALRDPDQACSDGLEDESGAVCCAPTCTLCGGEGCGDEPDGASNCCVDEIEEEGQLCADNVAPCILGGGAPDSGASDTGSTSDSGDSGIGTIVLAALLAALLLCNAICFFMFKRRKKTPTPPPPAPVGTRDANADLELGRLQGNLAAERNRRIRAEAIIQRAKGGGIRPGDFPSVRDVDRDVEKLAEHAIKWTEKAGAIGGSHFALPATLQSVLENTFLVCREEVTRCFDEKLLSLSEFLGNDEPIVLSGGDSMNLDTQYVLYECLRRNFRKIVPVEPERMDELAGEVQQRCGGAADGKLASAIVSGDAWPAFENLMKNYILVFVEMALQHPPMDFNDDLGKSRAFDPAVHRDWAQCLKAPAGEQCCVVFPAILRTEGRSESNAKAGVVRLHA